MHVMRRAAAGFSLIEIAIVLVVIGLLLSGGLLAISPVVQQSKVNETKAKMARIEAAIQTYVIANGCLPCPALGTRPSTTDPLAGAAQVGGTGNTAVCAGACNLVAGVTPWRNLGLSEADATDAFGNRITFASVSGLCDSTTDMIRSGSTYPAGANLVVNDAAGAITSAAAYVLISHGPDGSDAFSAETGVVKADRNNSATQDANTDAASPFNMLPNNTIDGANYFDDIVTFKTTPNIIQACGAGSCGNPS
jgi:prepilin-type N-terminal cleavage/methylation domain-containing protein